MRRSAVPRHRSVPAVLVLAPAVLAAACGDAADRLPRSEVRDSAGVTIVTNARPAPDEPPVWTVEAEPVVSIGLLEGEEAYLLSDVAEAVRLGDGRIAVANGGTLEIRFYAPDGSHVRSVGGEGEGPGEFLGLDAMVRLPGDSLGVWDFRNRRLTLLDPAGDLVRTVRMEEDEDVPIPFLQALLPDGSLLATAPVVFGGGDSRSGLVREPTLYVRFGLDGTALGPVLTLPGSEIVVQSGEGFVRVRTAPFSRRPWIHESPGGFVAGASDRHELGYYGVDGTLRRIVRTDHPVRPVDDALRSAYREEQLAEAADAEERTTIRQGFESLVYPPSLPAFSGLEVDASGHVWVRDYRPPGEDDGPDMWLVYDPDGRILGAVELPAGFTVHEIGEDHVLGTTTDELDVERVRLHRLRRGGQEGEVAKALARPERSSGRRWG